MGDVLVVQISETSKSIPYYGIFGDRRKSCAVDMEQSLLEIEEDEHMPLGNAIHGCSDMGRVLDVLLLRNNVVEVAWDDVLENELLPLMSKIGRLGFPALWPCTGQVSRKGPAYVARYTHRILPAAGRSESTSSMT